VYSGQIVMPVCTVDRLWCQCVQWTDCDASVYSGQIVMPVCTVDRLWCQCVQWADCDVSVYSGHIVMPVCTVGRLWCQCVQWTDCDASVYSGQIVMVYSVYRGQIVMPVWTVDRLWWCTVCTMDRLWCQFVQWTDCDASVNSGQIVMPFSMYIGQIMMPPREIKHMQHRRAPGPLPDTWSPVIYTGPPQPFSFALLVGEIFRSETSSELLVQRYR